MIKIRSIKEACTYIRSIDRETGVTENAIRCLVLSGQIPSVQIGRKHLINADQVVKYFEGKLSEMPVKAQDEGDQPDDIKPIPERARRRN